MSQELSPKDLADFRRDHPQAQVVDVRNPPEREIASIPETLFIPMPTIPSRIGELDKEQPVIVYCHTGVRSRSVAGFLEQHGFNRVYNLTGGIERYADEVDPQMPRY